MPKEREREREKEGLRRANREIERERERDHVVEPIPQIANPEIAKPILHRSSRTQKSPHHSSNPFVKPEIIPPNRRSACFGSISSPICLLSLISDFLVVVVVAWVVLVLLFSDFGLISDLMNFFLLGIENLDFNKFGFCWIWWYICLEAEKMWETW